MNEPEWTEVEFTSYKFKREKQPYISISPIQIKFNAAFVKSLENTGIDWYNYVNIWVDSKNKYLGFIFHNDSENPNKRKLTRQNGTLSVSSYKVVRKYSWLGEIANNLDPKKRKFSPKNKNGIYYISVVNNC